MYFRTLYTTSVINRRSQLTSSKPEGRHEELITFINLCMNYEHYEQPTDKVITEK